MIQTDFFQKTNSIAKFFLDKEIYIPVNSPRKKRNCETGLESENKTKCLSFVLQLCKNNSRPLQEEEIYSFMRYVS